MGRGISGAALCEAEQHHHILSGNYSAPEKSALGSKLKIAGYVALVALLIIGTVVASVFSGGLAAPIIGSIVTAIAFGVSVKNINHQRNLLNNGHVELVRSKLSNADLVTPEEFTAAIKDYDRLDVSSRDPDGRLLKYIMDSPTELKLHAKTGAKIGKTKRVQLQGKLAGAAPTALISRLNSGKATTADCKNYMTKFDVSLEGMNVMVVTQLINNKKNTDSKVEILRDLNPQITNDDITKICKNAGQVSMTETVQLLVLPETEDAVDSRIV